MLIWPSIFNEKPSRFGHIFPTIVQHVALKSLIKTNI